MAESPSPNKKKVKHSKLVRVATTKKTLKSEWKKSFLSSLVHQMMLASKRDLIEFAH